MEANLTKCKVCEQVKQRIHGGRFPNGRDIRWLDESGRQWVGRKCPDCHATKSKSRYKKKESVAQVSE